MEKINAIIIEDSKEVITLARKYFSKSKQVRVLFESYNGVDGLEKIIKYKEYFDVVILDIIMPQKDGIKVIEGMLSMGIKKKIIVTTDFSSPDMIRRTSELGISYYVLKPYEFEDLEEIIVNIFQRKSYDNKIIDMDKHNLEERLTVLLHELGVPSHLKGYHYLKTSVILIFEDSTIADSITGKLYPEIARIHNTSAKNVERSIRHCIEMSFLRNDWNKISEVFGNSIDPIKAKPTNAEFILTITDKIRMESFR